MIYKTIRCSSLLNKITKRDALFLGDYTIDPYQNCEFGCKYCDSSNTSTIYIKTNAPEVLERELKNVTKGRIIIGSVHDPYQNIEKDYKITRKILEGEKGPKRNVVLINASAALVAAGKAKDFPEGIKLAENSIDKGAATEKLEELVRFTQENG